ncbi:hypothetical protein C1X92_07985, partial [Pseudomonas sp. GP01-A15]
MASVRQSTTCGFSTFRRCLFGLVFTSQLLQTRSTRDEQAAQENLSPRDCPDGVDGQRLRWHWRLPAHPS